MTQKGRTATTLLVMNQNNRITGLDRHAYVGPPRGVRNAWPDEVDWHQAAHWSFDEELKTHVRRSRKPSISLDQALAILASRCVSR